MNFISGGSERVLNHFDDMLGRQQRHIRVSPAAQLAESALECDLLIATATAREFSAVKHAIAGRKGTLISSTSAGSLFGIADHKVVAVCLGQSPQTHGIRLTKCLLKIKPHYAVLVGGCGSDGGGSMLDSHGVGKVLVVDRAFNYECGKHVRNDDGAYEFKPDFRPHYATMKAEDLGLFIEEYSQGEPT